MNYSNLREMVESRNIVIPMYIYKYFDKFNIDFKSFVFLMYLYGKGKSISFNVKELSEDFSISIQELLQMIDILQKNKLIEIKVIKNEKNIMEEFIILNSFYDKVSLLIIEENKEKKYDTDIFSILESEIGKQLSPMEIELVKGWVDYQFGDEIIKEAIKEAVYNGVVNLRYIDKILFTWNKKGLKSIEDIDKNRRGFKASENKNPKIETYDDDWLEDDE